METKKKKRIIVWSIVAAVVVVLAIFLLFKKKTHEAVMLETTVAQMDSIEVTITATGEIQPVYKVEVGTQVSGIVQKLYVDYNSKVTKGQLLAELDRSTLQEQVNQANANLSNAQSGLTLAKQNYERIKALYDNKAATQESFEQATNTYVQAQNQVATAKSDLQRAQVNLSYARIYSPIDGIVLAKSVEEGQTVASSFSTPTLFTIANNLKQMQVEADVDEADIGQVKVGQLVTFTVDAFPDDIFTGTVKQIRLEPTVTSNVVTYTVIIDAPNEEEKLFPGMTASVSIITEKESGIAIPMEALFFTLKPQTEASLTQMGFTFESLYNTNEDRTQSLKDLTKKTIWVKKGSQYKERTISIGINDGAKTLVTSGLNENEEVVISEKDMSGFGKPNNNSSSPFMPKPPKDKQR